jgi:hypothetical protein
MMRFTLVITAALAAVLSAMPSARAAQSAICPSNHAAVKVADGILMTNSTGFVNVADSTVRFVQGGTQTRCVVVTFTAEAAAPVNHALMVRVLLDGEELCQPGEVFFSRGEASPAARAARAMSFLCTDVTPGPHRIRLEYRSQNSAGTVALQFRTVTVNYFK